MRGVDYYGQYLPRVMMISVKKYYEYKERVPDHPLECDTFLDKLFWSKFFTPMPIPTPADKLMIGEFIPRELENRVRPAKVYWSSAEPDIPRSIQGQDATYFLKTNNGWRSSKRIEYPIGESELVQLRKLGADWLTKTSHNLGGGEWWYSTIEPLIYIEEDLTRGGECGSEYKFQCAGGRVLYIFEEKFVSDEKVGGYENITLFDDKFEWLPDVQFLDVNNEKASKPANATQMLEVVGVIAKQFDSVRVDLYCSREGELILGELTLCDSEGITAFDSMSFDQACGVHWDFRQYFLSDGSVN